MYCIRREVVFFSLGFAFKKKKKKKTTTIIERYKYTNHSVYKQCWVHSMTVLRENPDAHARKSNRFDSDVDGAKGININNSGVYILNGKKK